ncbi:MAG: ribokinase [Candidatus Odinarchaeota archaeon]
MMSDEKYVLVIGSSNIDLNIYSRRFPKPGETVTGGTFKQFFGGKGANQAVASARSGSKTAFIGKLGQDTFGDQMLSNLAKEGIDTSVVIRDPDNASGVAIILIDSTGQNMISVAPGTNEKLLPGDIKNAADMIQNASSLVVQMEIPVEVIKEIFSIVSKNNTVKILNPAPFKPVPLDILKQVDIITPNENELLKLHSSLGLKTKVKKGTENMIQVMKDIHRHGVRKIVTTLGDRGCLVHNGKNEEVLHIPAFKVNAIDTVGAGDCFNGVLASRMCKGDDLVTAARYANAAASIAVTMRGAQTSMPFEKQIEERYRKMHG